MRISSKKLLHLPVFTNSGVELGRITELVINVDTQEIEQYYVKGANLIEEFFSKELLINRAQILSITDEKMIVEDSVGDVKESLETANKMRKNKSAPSISL